MTGVTQTRILSATLTPFNTTFFTWKVDLPPTPAGGPYTLMVQHNRTLSKLISKAYQREASVIEDVLFGEVWVCSGQSNMAFLLEMADGGKRLVQDANNYPGIRFLTTRKLTAAKPLQELGQLTNRGEWVDG
eukprot:CAMPEP_0119321620 /NCGR_PEP_ID=MMETSP1333-20130426/55915_1 /TAXON_ID=418940 /ORGANISM="Scyphosphaera apsteinii, Strain RCC1455" /LENGTH=131 /DNA_ID=CAMNT_0007328627 /DNA_START=247 /DNA_END=638 /DNA_ORIENTATION=-